MKLRVVRLWIAAMWLPLASPAALVDFAHYFLGKDGCFELYDLQGKKLVQRFNAQRCATRFAPCSTFKVPLALMAFDQRVLTNEHALYRWDGTNRWNPNWNRDTSAADWMKYSVVWYSQRITPQLGPEKIKDYLARFDYGNRDISGGLTEFWLGSSLKISADEQLRFWERFWTNGLPVSRQAEDLTRKIIYLETSPAGMRLSGKTGSHVYDKEELGWFVGHLEGPAGEYLVIANYSGPRSPGDTYPGLVTQGICRQILQVLGLY